MKYAHSLCHENPTSTAFSYIFGTNRSIVQTSDISRSHALKLAHLRNQASDETFLSNKMGSWIWASNFDGRAS